MQRIFRLSDVQTVGQPTMTSETSPVNIEKKEISLLYLFLTFLKVGTVSFGGNMALISVVKHVMVDRDKTLKNEIILDAISIGSLLPGPLAVNIVAYIGYTLKKTPGAVISMMAILLPAVTAMLILSWLYFRFGVNQRFGTVLLYITGAVAAIIFATALQLYSQSLKGSWMKTWLAIAGAIAVVLSNSFSFTLLLIVAGGIAGWLLKLHGAAVTNAIQPASHLFKKRKILSAGTITAWIVLACLLLLFAGGAYKLTNIIILKITLIFSGISLSLFGGGYVMIPIMQSLFVTELHWLTSQEFIDAIAFSQLTPGPILVSATFIGYKLYGFAGALLATFSIFTPSAILMIMVSKIYSSISHLQNVKHILAGVKSVVIGLVAGAAIKIGMQIHWTVSLGLIPAASFVMLYFYKISPVYIILCCAVAGILLWYFNIG